MKFLIKIDLKRALKHLFVGVIGGILTLRLLFKTQIIFYLKEQK